MDRYMRCYQNDPIRPLTSNRCTVLHEDQGQVMTSLENQGEDLQYLVIDLIKQSLLLISSCERAEEN